MTPLLPRLFVPVAVGLCSTLAFAGTAWAQPAEEEAGAGEEGEGGGAEGAEGEDGDKEKDDEEGRWGVGGEEEEGKFKPQGKTGKLKELEEEDTEEREEAEAPLELPPPGFAYLDWALGFGDPGIRAVAHPTGPTKVTPTASFLIGLGYRIGDTWLITARFPISTGDNDGPIEPLSETARDRDTYTQIAVGGFELGVMPHFILDNKIRIPAGLAIVFPSAEGDYFASPDERALIGKAIVNQAAASSRGFEDRALFQHKRLSFVPSGGLIYQTPLLSGTPAAGKLTADGRTKVEIMIKTGGNDPAPPADSPGKLQGEVQGVAVNWVTGASGFYDMFDGLLGAGLKLWLAVYSAPESLGDQQLSGAQVVLEPDIRTHLPFTDDKSIGIDARVGYTLPLGGDLGGGDNDGATIGGLRVTAGMFF